VVKGGTLYTQQAAKKAKPTPPQPAPSTAQAFNGQALTEAQLTDPRTTKPVIINSAQVIFGTQLGMGRTKAQLIEKYRQLIRDKTPTAVTTTAPAQIPAAQPPPQQPTGNRTQRSGSPKPRPTTTTWVMRRRSDTATIEFHRPFGGDSVNLTRQIQTAIRQASGMPEPPLTLLTGWWSTGLTNNFSLIFAGQPSQELVLKYRGVIGKFFDTTFHLIPSRGFTKMMIFGVPCIRKQGVIAPSHVLLRELSHNTLIISSCIVDGPTWSREALTDPSLEKSHCSFILIDPTRKKVQQIDRARGFAMFGAPVTIRSATVTQPYRQCDKCFLLNHDTQDCTKPVKYK
jgi:hypothetical protein